MGISVTGGVKIPQGKFSVGPAAAVETTDPLFSDVQLLLHFEGNDGDTTTTDNSNDNRTLTFANGSKISNAQVKFGNTSLSAVGTTNGRISISPVLDTSQSVWTIECWARINSANNALNFIWASGSSGVTDFSLREEGGVLKAEGNQTPTFTLTRSGFTADTWHHVAATRNGTTFRLFLNGVGTSTTAAGEFNPNSFTSIIGDQEVSGREWEGYIDEFRFTNAERYTSDFSAPTEAFPNA